jgi:alpha-tubulin suppressor-like RCC1 family protein
MCATRRSLCHLRCNSPHPPNLNRPSREQPPPAKRPVVLCLAAAVLALGLSACDEGTTEPKGVANVVVSPSSGSVQVAQTLQLVATARDAAGNVLTDEPITWSSSNASIASVNTVGLVTGVAEGSATITATCEGISGSASVTVSRVPVASVQVSPSTGSIHMGETLQLSATAKDAAGRTLTDRTFAWSSSDVSVATVSETGLVTGVGLSGVTIIATSEGKSGSAAVTLTLPILASVSAGHVHTCRVTAEGEAYCWGDGEEGELGNGTAADKLVPTLVSGGLTFASVSVGLTIWYDHHTCGVTTAGEAYCWGTGEKGQLGNGSTEGQWVPTPVSGGLRFTRVSAGGEHTCGVTTAGEAYCWGNGDKGQLGNGTTDNKPVPTPVAEGLTFASVSAGEDFTCGLTTAGKAYCWGAGLFYRLGNGSTDDRYVPTPVSGGLTFDLVSSGEVYHACGVTTGGEAYCWGSGTAGKLGDGSTSPHNQPFPLLVSGGLTFSTVDAGFFHTCGVTTGGQAYCWGRGDQGRLGHGSTDTKSVPTLVSGGLTFATVSAGAYYTCGLTTTGAAYCWGSGASGQLGNGSKDDKYVPTLVSGG